MSAKLFSLKRSNGPPSTQFAPTIVAMPDQAALPHDTGAGDLPNPDTWAPDSLSNDGSGAPGAVPDIVTDFGALPDERTDPADTSESPTLSHIGRYALKRQLGAGGLGTVFEAWDPLLSRAVAVKTLQFGTDPQSRSVLDGLFLNEARAAAGLNHRYIVTIHDAGLSPHGVYIAMERLYGRDLQQAIAEGWRPSVEQTVQLIRRVNEALSYAHARGVVHCDIKPANIFIQRRDRPKVLDFGIARIVHGAHASALDGALVGSPRYRAPEQLGGGAVDARTDLFSLGVVMYELLTGRRAFVGDSLAEINHAVLHTDPKPAHLVNPDVPKDISAIVARLMARAPSDRYTCASELNADLRRWIVENTAGSDLTLPAGRALVPPQAVPRPEPRARTARWLLVAGAALAAAAAVTAWGTLWRSEPERPAPVPMAAVPVMPAPAPVVDPPPPAPMPVESSAPVAEPTAAAPAVPDVVAPARPAPAERTAARQRPAPAVEPSTRDMRRADDARPAAPPAEQPVVAATGVVQIAVSPWADVEVDGKPQGTTPPLTRLTLSEGSHQITLRNADFAPHTVQVQVSADRPVTLRHRFGS